MAKKSGGTVEAPAKSDAYTGLLVISLLALMGGSALLFLDYNSYQNKKPPTVPTQLPKTGPAAPAGADGVEKDKDAPKPADKDAPMPPN
jgi:hypothetical protein